MTANSEVRYWLREVANERIHGTTDIKPRERLEEERAHLQAVPVAWRGDLAAARPQEIEAIAGNSPTVRPAVVAERIDAATPTQHPLAVYEQLLAQCRTGTEIRS